MDVVPCEIYACKFGAGPVGGDFVGLLQGRKEVVGVLSSLELDAEVIHDEDKKDRSPLVPPKAGCDETLVIAMFGEAFGELVVGQLSCLFKAVGAFVYFKIYPTVVCEESEVIFV